MDTKKNVMVENQKRQVEAPPVPDSALAPLHDSEKTKKALAAGLSALVKSRPEDAQSFLRECRQTPGQ
ncbi:MAG: hypothetical protein KJ052_06885 [Candidatus Hydrogenedentes bacterium]|nr:hypothetical protein [Candidatus Hydrogenedentota bacterium]